jgi:hypothetical protein
MQALRRAYVVSSAVFTAVVVIAAGIFLVALVLEAEWARAVSGRLGGQVEGWREVVQAPAPSRGGARRGAEITLWDLPAEPGPLGAGSREGRPREANPPEELKEDWEAVRLPLCELLNELFVTGDSTWQPLSAADAAEIAERLPEIRGRLADWRRRQAEERASRQTLRRLAPHTLARLLRQYTEAEAREVLRSLGPTLGAEVLKRLAPMDPELAAQLARSPARKR